MLMLRLLFFLRASWATAFSVLLLDNFYDASTQIFGLHRLLDNSLIVELNFESLFENLLRHLVVLSHLFQLLVHRYFFLAVLILKLVVGGCKFFELLHELIVLLLKLLLFYLRV